MIAAAKTMAAGHRWQTSIGFSDEGLSLISIFQYFGALLNLRTEALGGQVAWDYVEDSF
jgi:hypothetical protein